MNHAKKQGFTLIEIMLAMAFISILLLAIATIVIQIGQIYNRGLTFKEVNQTSRAFSDNLLRDISSSAPFSLAANDRHFYNNPGITGRLCLGEYSYVWNYGSVLASGATTQIRYSDGTQLRMARISDATGSYCAPDITDPAAFARTTVDKSRATELISSTDHNIVLHELDISTSPTATDLLIAQQLFTITYTIGTNDQTALKKVNGVTVCQQPGDANPDPQFCMVQQFNLVARAQNAVN